MDDCLMGKKPRYDCLIGKEIRYILTPKVSVQIHNWQQVLLETQVAGDSCPMQQVQL
jgi:hypothetical protein